MDISTSTTLLGLLANTSTPQILFSLASILAGIIAYKCSTTPNPKPSHAEKNDILFAQNVVGFYVNASIYFMKYTFIGMGILAAFLCLTYDGRPETMESGSLICPNPGNLSIEYIQPSTFSVSCLAVIISFGILRLTAFHQLGANFTFHLAKPSGLFTGGLYHYMQHPSYTGSTFFMSALVMLWLQPKGLMGCFVPESWAGSELLVWGFRVHMLSMMLWMTGKRVLQEEAMLKREFGREWVEYHSRTSRFLPGIF